VSDADRRYDHLLGAHLDMLNTAMKLAHMEIPPGNEELRQRIAVALEAVHGVEDALLEAMSRAPSHMRRAGRRAAEDGSGAPGRGGYAV
jgi:hypothetical protein